MADGVARVVVEADTNPAAAAFKKLQADADRAMDAIGRSRATAEVDAKTTNFDRKIDNAKRRIAELDAAKADPKVTIDDAKANAEIDKLEAKIKKLSAQRATIRVDAKELRDANKQQDLAAKKSALMSKRYQDEARFVEKVERARASAAAKDAADTRRMALLHGRAAEEDLQRTEKLTRARQQYGKVLGELQRLETKTGRPHGIFRTGSEMRDLDVAKAKVQSLGREIERLGGHFDDIDPSMEKNQGILGRWGSSLASVRVQMGFFSATLRQMAGGVVILGPILTGLLGGLVSLVGVLGAGLAGAAAVGAAGFAGFAASALGVGLIIKPMVKEFGEAKKASEALAKAQVKYGKNSTQAKTAQEQLNHTLQGVSPVAKQAFKDYGQLGNKWQELTKGAKPAVFDAFGSSIKTASALLPEFAHESVATTKVAGKAWEGWMKSLRSPEAKQLLGEVMSNFRESIPGIANGLGSIGAAFGRITASASKLLPSLSHGFEDWANNLEDSVGGGDALDDKIKSLVGDMKDLGHLSQDTGSFLIHLFGASSKSGDGLVRSLDGVIKRWDAWTQSAQGKSSLSKFFSESRQETEQFFSALAPLTRLLFGMSRAFAPITSGMLDFVNVVGDVVSSVSKLPGLKIGLEGLGAALGGIWAVGKVRSFASAIGDAYGAVKKLIGLQVGSDVASSGGIMGMFGKNKNAAKDIAALERTGEAVMSTGSAAAMAAPEIEGAGLALSGPLVVGAAAALIGIVALAEAAPPIRTHFQQVQEAAREAGRQFRHSSDEFVSGSEDYADGIHKRIKASHGLHAAERDLLELQEKKKPKPAEEAAAIDKINKAEQALANTESANGRQRTLNVNEAKKALETKKAQVRALEQEANLMRNAAPGGQGKGGIGNDPARLVASEKNLAAARRGAAAAAREFTLANIPLERQQKALPALSDKTTEALKKMSQQVGVAATKKIGNFVSAKDVAQIANLSNRLTKLGQGRQVKNIDVKSKGADETIGKLRQLQKQTNKVGSGVTQLTVKSNDQQANSSLRRLSALSQNLTGSNPTLKILANSSNAEDAVQKLMGHLRTFASGKYEAIMKARDASSGPRDAAYHKARDFASQKYEAILSAADRATAPLQKAISTAKQADAMHPQIPITAVNQASGTIQQVISEINGISSQVHPAPVIVPVTYKATNSPPSGARAMGGPSIYAATGAIVDRALRNAVTKEGGRGGPIRKPTMLTGEEAPVHNEYVITENPAYRHANERYLEQAATSIGREVVPAYKGGKGDGGKGKKSSPGASAASSSGPSKDELYDKALKNKPKPPKERHHFYLHRDTFAPQGVHKINEEEASLATLESEYSNLLRSEEQRLEHHQGPTHWEFGALKSLKGKAVGANENIVKTLIPNVVDFTRKERDKANHAFTDLGKEVQNQRSATQAAKAAYEKESSSLKPKGKDETSKAYGERKAAHDKAVREKKKAYTEAKAAEKRLIEERKHAKKIEQEAKAELSEIKHTQDDARVAIKELKLEEDQLDYYQDNPTETPYYEDPKDNTEESQREKEETAASERGHPNLEPAELALLETERLEPKNIEAIKKAREGVLGASEQELGFAKTTPWLADDIEAAGQVIAAREALNETSGTGANAARAQEELTTVNAARQNLYQQFASNVTGSGPYSLAAAMGSSIGAGHAVAAATVGGGFGASAITPLGSTSGAAPGSVTVVNHFSQPPPDPHTFSKSLQFELGAL